MGSAGIRVNALAPTVFRSELTEWMYADDEKGRTTREAMFARIPLRRFAEPEDFVGALIYLLSDASNFFTGQVMYLDGGYTACDAERNVMSFTWPLGEAESKLEFYDLSHPWGHGVPAWPYFEDVKIERLHNMARSRVLTQKITTVMHSGTHIDAPGHVIEGTPLLDEIPLSTFFGTGVVVSIPKKKWEVVTAEDLEKATPQIRPGDIVIVNTGWHHTYADSAEYYAYSPGFYKEAGEWFAAKGVKAVGTDTQALDHPLATSIGPHGPAEHVGGLLPWAVKEYEEQTGHKVLDDFRSGSRATARFCPKASTVLRTWVATSTRSPASASPSPLSRGAGSVATVASYGW